MVLLPHPPVAKRSKPATVLNGLVSRQLDPPFRCACLRQSELLAVVVPHGKIGVQRVSQSQLPDLGFNAAIQLNPKFTGKSCCPHAGWRIGG